MLNAFTRRVAIAVAVAVAVRVRVKVERVTRRDATDKRVLTFRQPHRPSMTASHDIDGPELQGHY